MDEMLRNAYETVFDSEGNVKACGRQACINLMRIIQCKTGGMVLGDMNTGIMDVEAVKDAYANLYRTDC